MRQLPVPDVFHLIELEDTLRASPNVDCRYFEAQEHGSRLSFDYRLRTGVSAQRLGMQCWQRGRFRTLGRSPHA